MFELFQERRIFPSRSICVSRRRRFQRCIFLSRDVREYGCDGAPAERILAPAGGGRGQKFAR
jgi:hypothetical protein